MKVEDAIKARRSIRQYSTKKVTWDELTKVLEAAIYAPMAGNIFSPRFVVVADKKKKTEIAQACFEQYAIQDASYLIVVCSDVEQVRELYGGHAEKYATQQSGAAVQNMLLQATELSLASCWIGALEEGSIKSALKIPDDIKVESIIALGNAKRKPAMPPKKDLNMVTFFEEYGKPGGWKQTHTDFQGVRGTRFEK